MDDNMMERQIADYMNKQNTLEAWICPIRYKEGAI